MHADSSNEFDWSASALGARAAWPHCLRLTVDVLLNCPAPMLLLWGRERVVVYNDAYARLAGPHQPPAPCASIPALWPAPWSASPDALELALDGSPSCQRSRQLTFAGPGAVGRIDCDLYFTPIDDQLGAVHGVLCALAPSLPAGAPHAAERSLRILVVEDNLDSQYLVCEMLKAFGHGTEAVAHAEDALALLAGRPFDVLFSDVSLPGMSGVELARAAVQAQPGLAVIFASGYGDTLLRHVEFPYVSLQKPYDIEHLQQALGAIAANLR